MAKSIEFTASGSCSSLGNFAPGTLALNIPDALADHLVKEAMCAKYRPVQPAAVPVTKAKEPPAEPARRTRKTKAADDTHTP